MSVNTVVLMGRLGSDVKLREVNGSYVANFDLATSSSFKDKSGQWVSNTEWHKVVVWGNRAKTLSEKTTKGCVLSVTGSLSTRSYDKNGTKVYVTEIKADNVQFYNSKDTSQEFASAFTTDDLPF